jgi:16S rRNA (cytosine967-C5)-methyltransferase
MARVQLSGRCHFLEFFSHIILFSHPHPGTRLLKVVSGQNPREIALEILLQRKTGRFVENLLDSALNRAKLSGADRGLCQELVYGVVRWQATLDWLIDQKTQNRPQKPILRELLRLGLYQIFWLERIPNHAAVNETVVSAKRRGCNTQSGFINAVLRGYLREFDATKKTLADLKTTRFALGFSHPEWLVERWEKRWGRESTALLLEWNNTPPKTYARVNLLKADPAKLLIQWRDEGVDYDFFPRSRRREEAEKVARESGPQDPLPHVGGYGTADWFPENLAFELKSHPPFSNLPSFKQGLFYIQDPSTLLAVQTLNPKPGEAILDLCAAPGGKLTYIAQQVQNEARIVAHDTSLERLKLIEENCSRLGATCVISSLLTLNPQPSTAFDRILLDAPCSNTGVMRRRVDLRWRVTLDEISRLRRIQLELLSQAASLLKPGGTLVYSTCSLEPEENEQLVTEFVQNNSAVELLSSRGLTPFRDSVDGAFVARLRRR